MVALQLEHRYRPRGACREVFTLKNDEVLVSGPAGTGKSRACLEKLHFICLKNRNVRALILRKTLSSLGSTALVTWRRFVAKEALATGDVVYYGGSSQEAPQYRYKLTGSTVTIGGMDRPSRIMSSEYDIIYVQEATELTIEDVDAINSRLRNGALSFQQLLMDCNPDAPKHWLKRRCNDKKTVLLESRHEDNPILFDESGQLTDRGRVYIGKLDNLTGVRKQRLRFGKWVAAEGIVYEEWDNPIHLIDNFEIPEEWPRYWSIDFGYINPFVCGWWASDGDGRLYLYREIYMTRRTVQEHARDMLRQVRADSVEELHNHLAMTTTKRIKHEWVEPKPRKIICDHDAENRAQLERFLGLGTVRAKKSIIDGIEAVQNRLKVQGDGKPRLFAFRDTLVERDTELVDAMLPVCTVDEFPGYIWDMDAKGEKRELPLDKDNHGMDMTRYMVADRDLVGAPRLTIVD